MKKIKKYLSKKEYIIFALSLVIILLSTFSFAFYLNTDNTLENITTTECFKLSFEDQDDINLDNAYPISDSEGSNLKPYTFTIRNICKRAGNYQVNIETLNNSTLSTNYLKYKLDNQTPSILGSQLEVQEYINNNVSESRNIEVGLILPNEEVTYNLRLWIDDTSTFEQTSEKEYSGKVVVKTIENKEPYQTIILHSNDVDLEHNEIIRIKTRSIGNIEAPQKIGYDFDGWYKDEELTQKIDSNTIVTSDITNLYTKYSPRSDTHYRVEHYQMDTNGNYPEIPYETEDLFGTTDTNVTPEVKTYEHFKIPQTQAVNVDADGSRVVKYYYERNKYRITFDANGGIMPLEYVDVYYGLNATAPDPLRNGYNFNGWFTEKTGGSKYTMPYAVTESLTIHAQWTEKTYSLTINPNGGSIGGTTSTTTRTLKYSDVYNMANPTKQWYKLGGFSELPSPVSATGLSGISTYDWNSHITITSQSRSSDNPLTGLSTEYKITNPGTAVSQPGLGGFVQSKTAAANGRYVHVFVAKLPVGFYFHNANNSLGDGGTTQWLTSNEGTGKFQTYIYKVNAGPSGSFSTFGHVYVSTSPTNTWAIRDAETHSYTAYLAYSNIYDITSNQNGIGQLDGSATLTATWVDQTYNLTINPNGGSWGGTTSSTTTSVGYSQVYNIANPTRSGKTFNGWSELSTAMYSGGLSSMNVYNNAGNGVVTITSQSRSSDNPLTLMSNQIMIKNSGTAGTRPGLGGFYQSTSSAANKVYVHVIVAKIPIGYYIQNASNAIGTGGSRTWLTRREGTGKWQTYVYKITTGSTGTFSTFGHIFLTKDANQTWENAYTETGAVTWYVAFANIYDITSNKNGIGQWDGSATLTATWK